MYYPYGHQLHRNLLSTIHDAKIFSILADETRDVGNEEQLAICIRWVDVDFEIYEDSDSLCKSIKDVLIRRNLPITECRGQGYDGASNMIRWDV